MTEGVLGRSSAPSLRLRTGKRAFTRLHAIFLSRRYAVACKRAARMASLSRFLSGAHQRVSVMALAAMPARYAWSEAVETAAGHVAAFTEAVEDGGARLRLWGQDVLSRRPAIPFRGGRVRAAGVFVFAAAAVLVFSTTMYGTGLEVIMDGQPMGYVGRQSEVVTAIDNVAGRVSDILGTPYMMQPDVRYRVSVVRRSRIFDQKAFEQQLFQSVGAVKLLHVLTIDGETIGGLQDRKALDGVLEGILAQYPVSGEGDTVGFSQNVQIEYRYTDSGLETDARALTEHLTEEVRPAVYDDYTGAEGFGAFCRRNGITRERLEMLNTGVDMDRLEDGQSLLIKGALPFLSVARGHRIAYETELPFEIEYLDNGGMYKGEERIKTKGAVGSAIVTAEQMELDGQIVGVNELFQTVTLEAVTQVVERGTKVKYALGTYKHPLPSGRLTSSYGYRTGGFHHGIDWAAPKGTKIKAADGGKVVFTGWNGTYGQLVIIQHSNSQRTLYAHCSSFLVKQGDMVAQGDAIARVGNTGRSTGAHLHFEIQINGKAVNPAKYVKR